MRCRFQNRDPPAVSPPNFQRIPQPSDSQLLHTFLQCMPDRPLPCSHHPPCSQHTNSGSLPHFFYNLPLPHLACSILPPQCYDTATNVLVTVHDHLGSVTFHCKGPLCQAMAENRRCTEKCSLLVKLRGTAGSPPQRLHGSQPQKSGDLDEAMNASFCIVTVTAHEFCPHHQFHLLH